MRSIYLLLLLPFVLALKPFLTDTERCIEIKDRRNLPKDVYTSLSGYNAILIGEVHGTNETPQFVEGMINLYLAADDKVLLGLEINQDDQANLDRYLQSGDFEIIKKTPFFNRTSQDGRSGTAMAELIRSLYKKDNVKIICLDEPYAAGPGADRDSIMAANAIGAMKNNTGWKLITLTGNVHNKTELGGFGYPMGYWVSHKLALNPGKQIASIDVVYESGSSWNCQGRNGIPVCKEYGQGNLSGAIAQTYSYENCFVLSREDMKFFTRKITTSFPLNN